MEHSADEMMTVAAARELRDGEVCFVGIGLPSTAANLARGMHAPDVVLIYESGTIGSKPTRLPLSIGDGDLAETADSVVSVPEIFNYWLQGGRIDVGFLGAAQIDREGNLNSTVIGSYDEPKVRLPGAGGAPEIAAQAKRVITIIRQSPRTLRRRARLQELARRAGPGGDNRPRRAAAQRRAGPGGAAPGRDAGAGARGDRLGPGRGRRPADHRAADAGGARAAEGARCLRSSSATPSALRSAGSAERLAGTRPDDLAATVVRALAERNGLETVDEVYFGDANQAGEDNRNVARMAVLLAGLPTSIPGATVNRLCGSGMEAAFSASRAIAAGDEEVCIAGGVESMSRAPWVVLKPDKPFPRTHETMHSTTLGWRMVNPEMPDEWTVTLGEGAEILADRYEISREQQDEFALESHQKAAAAWERGAFADEVVSMEELERDESIRADSTLEKLAQLKPVFRKDGTVTAGNSSPMNDAASALLLSGEEDGALARIASRASSAVEPQLYGIGPVEAAEKALRRAGIGWDDLKAVELNEAFAAQSLACLAEWKELDPGIVNVNGGAIALGHALGNSGTRLLTTLAWELRRRGGGWGLATMCIGVGQGVATVVEA